MTYQEINSEEAINLIKSSSNPLVLYEMYRQQYKAFEINRQSFGSIYIGVKDWFASQGIDIKF